MAEIGPGQDPYGSEDSRLTSLEERLKKANQAEAVRTGRAKAGVDRNYSLGNRVLATLLGSLVGGALIGWLLDRWFGTSPWLLLTLLALGVGAGFRNIIKIAGERPE